MKGQREDEKMKIRRKNEDPGRHFLQKVPPQPPPQKLLLFGPLEVEPLMRHLGGRSEVSLVSMLIAMRDLTVTQKHCRTSQYSAPKNWTSLI